jgi:hypothetical protein
VIRAIDARAPSLPASLEVGSSRAGERQSLTTIYGTMSVQPNARSSVAHDAATITRIAPLCG